jgi:hypothetical protein
LSKIEVDAVEPQSGTSLTLGASGDTITIPAGATFDSSAATTTLPATVVTTTGTQTLSNKTIDATQLTDSTVTLAKLSATGTKDATTFLRGDNTFATVSSYTDADALTLFNASGSAPVYACRAWVNFDGTGTVAIRASGNVSSITDNNTGNYTVNFTTAMSDVNFASLVSCNLTTDTSSIIQIINNQTTSTVQMTLSNPGVANYDSAYVSVAVFR